MKNLLIILGLTLFVHGLLSCRQGDDDVIVTPPQPEPIHPNQKFVGQWHENWATASGCNCDTVTFSLDGKITSHSWSNLISYRVLSSDSLEFIETTPVGQRISIRLYRFEDSTELFIDGFRRTSTQLPRQEIHLVKH